MFRGDLVATLKLRLSFFENHNMSISGSWVYYFPAYVREMTPNNIYD